MVAKINVGSSLLGVLAYNQKKIDQGKGEVLATNKMTESVDGVFELNAVMRDFESYLPSHHNTEKPVIHISLNPHPDDVLTNEQLADIAKEYIEKLGYGDQPYIVYKHEDISRHHLHIVSLRVDETGRKLNDKFEHRRSKDITRALEQKYGLHTAEKQQRPDRFSLRKVTPEAGDVKRQIGNVVKHLAGRYHFLSFNEYRALLSLYNISAQEVKGEVGTKFYNGIVYSALNDKGEKVGNPFKSSLFGKSTGYESLQSHYEKSKLTIKDRNLAQPTKRRALEALRHSTDKATFRTELRNRGLEVVLRENSEGRIYGATFVDHTSGCVLNGSRLGKELSANAITEWFNNPQPLQHSQPIPQPAEQNDKSIHQDHSYDDDANLLGGLLDLPIETHGIDPEEERFRKRMQRKKKRGQRI